MAAHSLICETANALASSEKINPIQYVNFLLSFLICAISAFNAALAAFALTAGTVSKPAAKTTARIEDSFLFITEPFIVVLEVFISSHNLPS